jgi:hypothetical protein
LSVYADDIEYTVDGKGPYVNTRKSWREWCSKDKAVFVTGRIAR